MKKEHSVVMDELKSQLDCIDTVVPPGSKIIYLDYPLHFNVGDQLIYLGTLEFFEKKGYVVEGFYSEHNLDVDSLSCDSEDTIILFHGGGNFGDLYPKHQFFRESVVKKFPKNKIVVLPQTIYFIDDSVKKSSAEVFSQHSDLTIYARDQQSYNIACKFSDKCFLMPDMAHYLWQTPFLNKHSYVSEKADSDVVLLQDRVDFESAGVGLSGEDKNKVVFDWYELLPFWLYKACSVLSVLSKVSKNNGFMSKLINYFWMCISRKSVSLSAKKINGHAKFVTTRLHGHIFAQLISHPNVILDNKYGKIRNYANCWTIESDMVEKGRI